MVSRQRGTGGMARRARGHRSFTGGLTRCAVGIHRRTLRRGRGNFSAPPGTCRLDRLSWSRVVTLGLEVQQYSLRHIRRPLSQHPVALDIQQTTTMHRDESFVAHELIFLCVGLVSGGKGANPAWPDTMLLDGRTCKGGASLAGETAPHPREAAGKIANLTLTSPWSSLPPLFHLE